MESNEHFDKYEALSQKIGIDFIRANLPVPPDRIKYALEHDDEHLNTIPLRLWDTAAGAIVSCRGTDYETIRLTWNSLWSSKNANGLSLCERVCILKHVAKYHLL